MRTPHTILRLLAVVSVMLVAITGVASAASAAARQTSPAISSAAKTPTVTSITNTAACAASVKKQLPATMSVSDIATAVKEGCDLQISAVSVPTPRSAGNFAVPATGGGYCPCTYWDWTTSLQVYGVGHVWSATMHAEWSGDGQTNFVTRTWPEDYLRCGEDYAYGYSITMGSCVWGGPDTPNHGETMTSHFDFVVTFVYSGWPVSVSHGGDITYYVTSPAGHTSSTSY